MADESFIFRCSECRRMIIHVCGPVVPFDLCGACLILPGWFRDPELRARLGLGDEEELPPL